MSDSEACPRTAQPARHRAKPTVARESVARGLLPSPAHLLWRAAALLAVLCVACSDPGGPGHSDVPGPSELQVTAISASRVRLSWQDNSATESGFQVYRGVSADSVATLVDSVPVDVVTYEDTALSPSTTYHYRVYAYDDVGQSSSYANGSTTTLAASTIALSDTTLAFWTPFGGPDPDAQMISITGDDEAPLTSLTTSISYPADSGWLSVTLDSTTAPVTLTVHATSATLSAGTYTATIAVEANDASNSPRFIEVRLTVDGWVTVTTGASHTCALRAGGQAYCWGLNDRGRLGDGTEGGRLRPTAVVGGLTFASLGAGFFHTCGLTPEGTAYCWGNNFLVVRIFTPDTLLTDSLALVGDGTTTDRLVPTRVAGGLAFMHLAVGSYINCTATPAGMAYCWGLNRFGQIGDGTATNRMTPTAVAGGLRYVTLTTEAFHTCGLTDAGAAYCWGYNGAGHLGDGTSTGRWTPTAVVGGLAFIALTAGTNHTCGLTAGGTAYCWGSNYYGQLGDGTSTSRHVPTAVMGGLTFRSLAGGTGHTCGITPAGAAYCWGYNGVGHLGDGTSTGRWTPTAVVGGLAFIALTAGPNHTCGLTAGGTAYCWGSNYYGQLGDGTRTSRLQPVKVIDP